MANVTVDQRTTLPIPGARPEYPSARLRLGQRFATSTLWRVLRYTFVRGITLLVTLAIGVYIAVAVANLGGFIDDIIRDRIEGALQGIALSMQDAPPGIEQPEVDFDQLRAQMEDRAGLNQPFLLRCLRWTYNGLRLEWSDSRVVQMLPNTLLLFGTASVFLFFAGIGLSLFLSRHYGTVVDRIVTALSPISSAPSWAHGILLIMVFTMQLHLLPASGMLDDFPPTSKLGYALIVGKHMILPVTAILLSSFFQVVYAWRTFFVLHSEEDHVTMATALGLSPRRIERRDVLRPALPYLVTSFALMLLGFWQTAIVLESFFWWPGIGKLYVDSMRLSTYSPETVVSLVVVFAYLLAITVFILDLVYAVVDPRVRLTGGALRQELSGRPSLRTRWHRLASWPARLNASRAAAVERRLVRRQQNHERAGAAVPRGAARAQPGVRASSLPARLRPVLEEIVRYPSAFFGMALIVALLASATTTMLVIPYREVVEAWRGGAKVWYHSPERAQPVWVNLFRAHDLPPSLAFDSRDPGAVRQVERVSEQMTQITVSFPFDYDYHTFPRDLVLYFKARYETKKPHVVVTWVTPDAREVELASWSLHSEYEHHFSLDEQLERDLGGLAPPVGLFADPAAPEQALPGRYEMRITSFVFEDHADVDVEFVLLGKVYGLAGTDHMRRDLIVPLLWGMPIALAMGLLGAVASSLATMLLAAIGAWFGGWVDSLIQRITEINVILPMLPVCIMVYYLYGKNVWLILSIAVLLNVFGSGLKNYRAAFLQVRESPYIEAARAYGASHSRVIVRYLVPRILPVLVPQLVMLVPSYVFLEATLAILGVGDPLVPTWGQMIYDALRNGAFGGHYYWVFEPIALLMLTAFAFALLGFALERIFEPRLRDT